jgi:predicted metal-dependent hydrolase
MMKIQKKNVQIDGMNVLIFPCVQSRCLRLKIDIKEGGAVLTCPVNVKEKQIADFLEKNKQWLKLKLDALPEKHCFEPEMEIVLFGKKYLLSARPEEKRGVYEQDGLLCVCGHREHFHRRVKDFIKKECLRQMQKTSEDFYQKRPDMPACHFRVKEMTSRWGSCSADGNISLSWRLALAPKEIFDYVLAHEMAHLKEMNHSAAFWQVVFDLYPAYKAARRWLSCQASLLYIYE